MLHRPHQHKPQAPQAACFSSPTAAPPLHGPQAHHTAPWDGKDVEAREGWGSLKPLVAAASRGIGEGVVSGSCGASGGRVQGLQINPLGATYSCQAASCIALT